MKTVLCPVKGDEINGTDCLIICDVSDGMIKPSFLPDNIVWNEKQCRKCKACKYHDDLD